MTPPVTDRFTLRIPGSVANLGPGFDTLAVAVQLYLELDVTPLGGTDELVFDFLDCKVDGENYIERAFRLLAAQTAHFPSLRVAVRSEIPMKGGLGSSAAATVAGLRLYEAVTQPLAPQDLLNAACALEGHPDNVAASLLGGLTISCELPDRSAFAVSLDWPETLVLIVLTPDYALSTASSRRVLPAVVPREDAVFNLQRVALLLQALQSGRFALLREALNDRLHQPFRQALVPGLQDALGLEHPGLLGVCLSGAGPSIVAFAQDNLDEIRNALGCVFASHGVPFRLRELRAHQGGSERHIR